MEQLQISINEKPTAIFLVVGKTGSGKSTLINSFVNHYFRIPHEKEKLILIPYKKGQKCSFPEHERNYDPNEVNGKPGESKTQKYHIYPFENDERKIVIIDTPGIGDTRGPKQDKKNIEQIIEGVKKIGQIQGIICVINSESRSDQSLKYCVDEIKKIMTSSFLDRFFVICTKTNRISKEVKSVYDEIFGTELSKDRWFAMDNLEFCDDIQDEKEIEDSDDEDSHVNKGVWEIGSKIFEKIYKKVSRLAPKPTKEMEDLFLNRKELEDKIRDRIENVGAVNFLKEEISKLETEGAVELESIEMRLLALEKEESQFEKKYTEPTMKPNFNCNTCQETCFEEAGFGKYVLGTVFTLSLYHWISEGSDCKKCNHSHRSHVFEKSKWHTRNGIHEKIRLQLLELRIQADTKGKQQKLTKMEALKSLEQTRRDTMKEIAQLMEEIQKIGIMPANYDSYVENLKFLIETAEKKSDITQDDRKKIEELKNDLETYEKIKAELEKAKAQVNRRNFGGL